jgi:hypothetical protein
MALALLSVSVLGIASGYGIAGSGGVDILGDGIFETDGSAIRFPEFQNTNIDTVDVGNDKAIAFGSIWQKNPVTKATNNLEIKKNQDVGPYPTAAQDLVTNTTVNIETIKVGNREAMAFGLASATNNVKIVTNQQ